MSRDTCEGNQAKFKMKQLSVRAGPDLNPGTTDLLATTLPIRPRVAHQDGIQTRSHGTKSTRHHPTVQITTGHNPSQCQHAINVSKPYTSLAAFMTRRYDDGYYSPIERLLDVIKDQHKRAALLLEDSLTRSPVPDLTMRREGLILASDGLRSQRHLLWFWEDDDDDDDKTTTTTSTAILTTTEATMPTTTTKRTKTRRTKRPTKPSKPTTPATPKPKPITKPKPGKTTSVKPTPKASTIREIVTESQTDFYFDGDNGDVTTPRYSPSNEKSTPSDVRSKEMRFFDDEDFGFSGSGLGSGDMDEDLLTTAEPVTSSTAPPTTTTAPPIPWVDWAAIRKLVKKSAKPLKKDSKKHLQRLNSIEKTKQGLVYRVNTTVRTHLNIKRSHKMITRNLDLKRLKNLDGKSDGLEEAVSDVIKREGILKRKCQSMVFSKAPFMEKYKQTLMSLDSYAQGSYSSMDTEMKQLRRTIQDVDEASTSLYKRALTMNDTIKELGRQMDVLRDKIQTARIALSGIHPKVRLSGSATYTLQHDIKSGSFHPGSLHFKIRTHQPDGAIVAIQASGRPPLRNTRRINNRLAVGLHQGKVTVYIEPWRSKWTLPGVINDGRWHEISIYILDKNLLLTESVLSNVYTGEYMEVQRRMYGVPERIEIKQYFKKKYFFLVGQLPYASWERPLSPRFGTDQSNVYTLYGANGDQFMFNVWYTGQPEGGVVVYLALSPTLHISLHHRHRRIIVTLIEGDRYASAVCRTYGSDQSTHSIFAIAREKRVEFDVDCERCQSLPFLSSISRHFPFYKPELIVAPTNEQLDYYLYKRPRARRQVAPFNGVIGKVTLDGVVLYKSSSDKPGCEYDLDTRHRSRRRHRHKT
ncbi:hypothetical protein LSH36_788g01013 [Paralvinella palmiformis]|uniref:Laminin G domain-containing protein n=1 Tax=Paralvinella palmiformis TaxID=53620 RepID=A0AAD9J023_9ANNE|nr:hypothetical protein LSH36_788g01013 [Paralvinella palmiformis]